MHKISILLVDDEDSIRTSLTRMLENKNFKVKTAMNGSLALEELENDQYDIVLSDIMMVLLLINLVKDT